MNSERYLVESDRTRSPAFHADRVSARQVATIFAGVAQLTHDVDALKKLLWHGKPSDRLREPNALDGPFMFEGNVELLHGVLGLLSEAGELLEAALAPRLDVVNVREEIGDSLWYLARIAKVADTTFEVEMDRNIAKLSERYPDRFSETASAGRDVAAERRILEG